MEQTLGKRIAEYRKQQKLTQDQLAERLGITAQAISKWENDQSCPDITILPQLAAIFGISVDVLLGADPTPVHQGQVMADTLTPDEPSKGKHWELHVDTGRKGAIGFALWVLLVGGLLLANTILEWNIGLWSIAWPTALIMLGLFTGKGFSFFRLGLVAVGSYFMLENLPIPIPNLDSSLIWPVAIIIFGLASLADALRKPKKATFSMKSNDYSKKRRWESSNEADSFNCNLSFGDQTHHVSSTCLHHGSASVNFGQLTVDLSDCESISDDCRIDAKCSFGELELLVPKQYRVESSAGTTFAAFSIDGEPNPNPDGTIYLESSASFGEITVRYI